jgi:hypothetical protein
LGVGAMRRRWWRGRCPFASWRWAGGGLDQLAAGGAVGGGGEVARDQKACPAAAARSLVDSEGGFVDVYG